MTVDYKCDICGKEFKNRWRLDNHECPRVKKVDLSTDVSEPVLIHIPVPDRPIDSVPEPEPILESRVRPASQKHSRDWGKEILAQTPKRLHKYF